MKQYFCQSCLAPTNHTKKGIATLKGKVLIVLTCIECSDQIIKKPKKVGVVR